MSGPQITRASLSGRSFSNFDILEKLGGGAMGVVYRAVDCRLGRSVALKFLSSHQSMEGESRERFLREARAASALDHPNVGTIYGIEEGHDGELCIVMAYYEGETLAARIARGPIPIGEALRIAIHVADGLAEAHENGIIHRDVKPSNILLTRNDGVKVVDFGLAKFTAAGQTLTHPSAFLGTAAYASVEQVRGTEADSRSDIWSLGAVLYEMVSGLRPFRGADTYAVLYSVVHDEPAPLGEAFAELEPLIRRALEKKPSDRYRSMREFGAALREAAIALGVQSSTQSYGLHGSGSHTRLLRPAWRKPLLATAAMLAAACGSLLIPAVRSRVAEASGITVWKPKPMTVAVLPFQSGGEDPETAALAGGLSEALSGRIARLERFSDTLSIVPASELVTKKIHDAEDARKLLGATLAVSGVLTRAGTGGMSLRVEVRDSRRSEPVRFALEDAKGDTRSLEDRAAAELSGIFDIRADRRTIAASLQGGPGGGRAYDAYLQGLGYLQRWDKPENLAMATRSFGDAIQANPTFAPAYVGLAEASRTAFRVEKDPVNMQHALRYAQRAIQLDGKLPDAHVVLGRIYQDTAQRDLAVIEFERALTLEPRTTSAIAGMGRAYEDMGRAAEAESAYLKAVSLNPYAWTPYNSLANFYFRKARFTDAEVQFRRALALTPDNPALCSNLGVVLMKQKKLPDAIAMFRRSLELGPSYAAYLNLGNISFLERDFAQAAAAYAKALELNNKDFRIWGTRAQALRLSGSSPADTEQAYRRAIELGEASLRLDAGQPRTLSLLGLYYACLRDRAMAEQRLQQALTKTNADRDVFVDAATAYELLGDRTNAVRWADEALAQGYPWADFRDDPDLAGLARSGIVQAKAMRPSH